MCARAPGGAIISIPGRPVGGWAERDAGQDPVRIRSLHVRVASGFTTSWAGSCRRLTLRLADEAGTTATAEFKFVK